MSPSDPTCLSSAGTFSASEATLKTEQHIRIPERLHVVVALAQLLERMGNRVESIGAAQYQSIVRHLADELDRAEPGESLEAILAAFPATAEVYENVRYERAGLCRSPLELSLSTELEARSIIQRVQTRGPLDTPAQKS